MKFGFGLAAVVCACLCGGALAETDGYVCSLKVGNADATQRTQEKAKKSRRTSVEVKTRTKIVSWPVTVTFTGTAPTEKMKLVCTYVGTDDGKPDILATQKIDVELDEKGAFKTDVVSPEAKLVEVTKKKQARKRRGGASSTKSEQSGTRITGCIIQLLVGDEVVKSFVSKPSWSKLARQHPLDEAAVLKLK